MKRSWRYNKEMQEMEEVTGRVAMRRGPGRFPYECYASGVHASQAGELREVFKSAGEKVEVTSDGNPIYTSRKQRARLLKLRGMCDRG